MSRNPILTDKAFGLDGSNGNRVLSPAEEWEQAQARQRGVTGGAPPYGAAAGAAGAAGAADATLGRAARADVPAATDGKVMTMGGVAAASLVLFAFLVAAALFGWQSVTVTEARDAFGNAVVDANGNQVFDATMQRPLLLIGALIAGLVLAFVTAFKPKLARITGIGYAICEGYLIGAVSAFYGARFPGIVAQAILATLGVFLMMLVLYGLRILRATPKFVKGVIAATFGIAVVYGVMLIANLFGVGEGFWTSGSPLGIVISLVVVAVAALNLVLDFDFIERGSQNGLPRYMDWYGAFGLLVTLIWLYLEMLRLLARLRQ
jgi:uncharacterized YccA/Bax inhibitor family protein